MKQGHLFFDSDIHGFRYQDAVVDVEQEQALARHFATLAFKPFEFHGHLGNRRVISFGFRYDYGARRLDSAAAVPDFLLPLRDLAAQFAGVQPDALVHALVTEYAPGAGIGWHRDKPQFEKVVALSFCASCRLRFRRRQGDRWKRQSIDVAPRSAYLLDGDARSVWEHSIAPMDKLRYSVTFRTMAA